MAVRDIRDSHGLAVTVTDEEIIDAIGYLGRGEGIFAEPAAAAGVAALRKLAAGHDLAPEERVVVLITDNGLKDVEHAMLVQGNVQSIPPAIEAVEHAVAAGF